MIKITVHYLLNRMFFKYINNLNALHTNKSGIPIIYIYHDKIKEDLLHTYMIICIQ